MKCKILQLLLIKLYNTFKLPLLAAILRQQQVENIIK